MPFACPLKRCRDSARGFKKSFGVKQPSFVKSFFSFFGVATDKRIVVKNHLAQLPVFDPDKLQRVKEPTAAGLAESPHLGDFVFQRIATDSTSFVSHFRPVVCRQAALIPSGGFPNQGDLAFLSDGRNSTLLTYYCQVVAYIFRKKIFALAGMVASSLKST